MTSSTPGFTDTREWLIGQANSKATRTRQSLETRIRKAPPMRESDIKLLADLLAAVPRLNEST